MYRIVPSSYCSIWINWLSVGNTKKCRGLHSNFGGRFELPNIQFSGITRLHEKNRGQQNHGIKKEIDDDICGS